MNLIDLGKTVAKFAPFLGSVLPIPGGAVLGEVIAKTFNGDWNNPDGLIKKIEADPEAEIKLRQLELSHSLEIERLKIEAIKADAADRDSARRREIEVKDKTPSQLATLFTVGYLGMIVLLAFTVLYGNITGIEQKILEMAMMGLTNAEMLILAYYYGASNRRD